MLFRAWCVRKRPDGVLRERRSRERRARPDGDLNSERRSASLRSAAATFLLKSPWRFFQYVLLATLAALY
ncbi:hypothetical protein BN903_73 [Halorubrum sp. AJ67]|nr:hypothetical protein BN903_73 [Halorubrum sp. AJ67]